MKAITTYVAFDDEEFSTAEECLAYEKKFSDAFSEILNAATFYDENGHEIVVNAETEDMNKFCDQMDDLTDRAWKIKVNKPITYESNEQLVYLLGSGLPREVGYYEYDTNEWEWKKRG